MIEYNPAFVMAAVKNNPRKVSVGEMTISLTDTGMINARKFLEEFTAGYNPLDRNHTASIRNFAKVREYHRPETGLLFEKDSLAKGSLIVHIYRRGDGVILPTFFYISPNQKGFFGEPIMYQLNHESNDYGFLQSLGEGKLTNWIEKKARESKEVTIVNKRWGKDRIKYERQKGLFMVRQPETDKAFGGVSSNLIEVWKHGTAQKEKQPSRKIVKHFTPIPQTIPIPI